MNDATNNEAPTTESEQPTAAENGQSTAGRGKHRGPVSMQDSETAPRGRHRRPAEENERVESAA